MNRLDRITATLKDALQPSRLEVIDDSHKHAGHAGASPDGETHYTVVITSEAFKGLTRVQIHQKIYALLDAELQSGLHALAIKATHLP
jgi:BolA family transcriptional regulator, general stress-responsive regulator